MNSKKNRALDTNIQKKKVITKEKNSVKDETTPSNPDETIPSNPGDSTVLAEDDIRTTEYGTKDESLKPNNNVPHHNF